MYKFPVEDTIGTSPYRQFIDKYVTGICQDDHVIDIGCGTGETSFYLQQKFNCHLTAVDVDEAMITYVKQNYKSDRMVTECMDIQERDLQAVASQQSYFSLATSFFALHWVHDIDTSLDNIYRLLKPGGRAILLVSIFPEVRKFMSAMLMRIMENPRWKEWVNLKRLETMSVPWLLASIDPSKGLYWLTQRNALKDMLPRHGFDVQHYEITTGEFPMTKAFMKRFYPVLDLVPQTKRDEFFEDMMNILSEEGTLDGQTDIVKEEISYVIVVAVKSNAQERL